MRKAESTWKKTLNPNRRKGSGHMLDLYKGRGLEIYEKSHYGSGEHISEVEDILKWCRPPNNRALDLGCSGGLHAIEFAKRDFSIIGLDIERSAISLARARCRQEGAEALFYVSDIANVDLWDHGQFGFIYSIGNVLSHIEKSRLSGLFAKLRQSLSAQGVLLFDILLIGLPFKRIINEKDRNIIWKRSLNKKTGKITLKGEFNDFNFVQHFDLWGYEIREILDLLNETGFTGTEISENLAFDPLISDGQRKSSKNPHCLTIRTFNNL